MHVHLLTLGSRGDVQPYLALGAALKDRGHDVTVTTGLGFDAMIEAQGLASAPIDFDVRAMLEEPDIQEALRSFRGKLAAWRNRKGDFIGQMRETAHRVRETRADAIVYHPKMAGAPYLGAELGIPAICSYLIPGFTSTGDHPFPLLPIPDLGRFANRLSHRAIHGLTDRMLGPLMKAWWREDGGDPSVGPFSSYDGFDPAGRPPLRLHAYSAHLMPRPSDWPARDTITGFWWLPGEPGWQPPAALKAFLDAGPPPVYAGFGSMPTDDAAATTRIVLEALERSGNRGVLATAWGGLAATDLPETVFMLDMAPHGWLFPRCAAVVHHGGAGTTHEGLRAGRSSVICPVSVDQPFWGRRVHALGAGPKPIPQKALSAERLAAALAETRDPAMRTRAEVLGEEIRAEGGAAEAARLIEDWVGARRG